MTKAKTTPRDQWVHAMVPAKIKTRFRVLAAGAGQSMSERLYALILRDLEDNDG
jgi:hypothetical protein